MSSDSKFRRSISATVSRQIFQHMCSFAGSSTGSWDIDAAHPDGSSSPTSQMAATHISSRQQSVTTTGSHDVQDASEVRQVLFQIA